jgi:hypothetical protein
MAILDARRIAGRLARRCRRQAGLSPAGINIVLADEEKRSILT